jgi:sigma-E factor negative regulatory protein RseC
MSGKEIVHEGVVEEVGDHRVVVKFISNPACSDCHAKGFCSVPASDDKHLEVTTPGKSFITGEKVRIILSQSHGFSAVFLAYLLPFILVISILFILYTLTHHEALSGISSLVVLLPYYLVLWRFRNNLGKKFNFRIRKF